jgi:hypothetical protein
LHKYAPPLRQENVLNCRISGGLGNARPAWFAGPVTSDRIRDPANLVFASSDLSALT